MAAERAAEPGPTMPIERTATAPDADPDSTASKRRGMLDRRDFLMVSSTASAVDRASPTRFRYSENAGLVWGEYTGDTVTEGRFVGERVGRVLTVHFIHALARDGSLVSGSSVSRIETGPASEANTEAETDAPLRLVEDFVIDGHPHVSVCVEVQSPSEMQAPSQVPAGGLEESTP